MKIRADSWSNLLDDLELYSVLNEGSNIISRGNFVPDAHIAAILRQHGVHRIYTADIDFRKFAFLEVVNPLP